MVSAAQRSAIAACLTGDVIVNLAAVHRTSAIIVHQSSGRENDHVGRMTMSNIIA